MTTYRSVELLASRIGTDIDNALTFSEQFRLTNMGAVIEYIERRIKYMRGDENVKAEVERIRKDLGLLSTLNLSEVRKSFEASRNKPYGKE